MKSKNQRAFCHQTLDEVRVKALAEAVAIRRFAKMRPKMEKEIVAHLKKNNPQTITQFARQFALSRKDVKIALWFTSINIDIAKRAISRKRARPKIKT